MASSGEAPESWEVSLPLVRAPADAVFPVIEISTPLEATPTLPAQAQTSAEVAADGISLALDRAVQMDDGYLIYVTIHYENTGLSWIELPDPTTLHLLEASGQEVSYELDWEATNEAQTTSTPGQTPFAIKTAPIQTAGPLTLRLESVTASVGTEASLSFDPGPNPTPGQSWELNQEIDFGNGQRLHISKATYDLTDGVQAYLSFEMESGTGITYATLFDEAHPLTGMGGGGGGVSLPGPFISDLYYLEPLPRGLLTVKIIGISIYLPGRWETVWTPPE
jgi:hypothetical protein